MGVNLKFKIKLATGRVVGPIDLPQVRQLMAKGHITGDEQGRVHPGGDWTELRKIPEVAEEILAFLARRPREEGESRSGGADANEAPVSSGKTATIVLSETPPPAAPEEDPGEKTLVAEVEDATEVGSVGIVPARLTEEKTIAFDREGALHDDSGPAALRQGETPGIQMTKKSRLRPLLIILVVAWLVFEGLDLLPTSSTKDFSPPRIRVAAPAYAQQARDPLQSKKLFEQGMRAYNEDNVVALTEAARLFHRAASLDQSHTAAHAMLAATYLALIDSVSKDEKYFFVIYNLIGISQGREVETPETILAYVEYYLTADRLEAAREKIVSYTKTNRYGPPIYYLLARVLHARGSFQEAAGFLQDIAEKDIWSPKVYYLRGLIAKELDTPANAIKQFELAIQMNPAHAKSRLEIVRILEKSGEISRAASHLEFLALNPGLLSPPDLADAYYYRSRWKTLERQRDEALGDIERAVKLMPDNATYRLESFALRAAAGAPTGATVPQARMYYFLDNGQKLLRQGKYQEALVELMQARQADLDSPLPPEKIGDLFILTKDVRNARENYKKASEMSPGNLDVWSKYIGTLIDMYEFKEASDAIDRKRGNPRAQSMIDKRAGDQRAKQGLHKEAITLYQKAMRHAEIDPAVYISLAKSLAAIKNYNEAALFFALARRIDPLDIEAIRGAVRAIAESEGTDAAGIYLRDELKSASVPRAELLTLIGELELQKGNVERAENYAQQALAIDSMLPSPYRLKAQAALARNADDRKSQENALNAYKNFSDRNPSDPTGYEERYKIFLRQRQFERAFEELDKIFSTFPKYPRLHLYRGRLYSELGDHKKAADEYRLELENHGQSATVMVQLGSALMRQQNLPEALDWFVKAINLEPAAAEPKYYAGYCHYEMKNYTASIALLQQAAKIDSGNPMIFRRLGISYLSVGDRINGCQAFAKYLELATEVSDNDRENIKKNCN